MAYESAQGLSFVFSGKTFNLTSVSFSKKVSEIDVSSLSTKHGDYRSYRAAPLRDGDELQIEFYGMDFPQMTATGALTWDKLRAHLDAADYRSLHVFAVAGCGG